MGIFSENVCVCCANVKNSGFLVFMSARIQKEILKVQKKIREDVHAENCYKTLQHVANLTCSEKIKSQSSEKKFGDLLRKNKIKD